MKNAHNIFAINLILKDQDTIIEQDKVHLGSL